MSAYELIDLATGVNTRIDVQLGIFVTVHLALFGGIIYIDRPLRSLEKVFAVFVYSGFAGVNYLMMAHQAALANAMYGEALKYLNDPCCSGNQVLMLIQAEMAAGRAKYMQQIIAMLHSFFYTAVVLSIIFDRGMRAKIKPGTA
ncbi:MAG: hypothetical protein AAF384_14845 [Pseudomonadota bacterium]